MNLHTLKKFTIADEIIGDHDIFGPPDTYMTKICLGYKDKKGKFDSHNLTVPRNKYYKDIPEKYYLQGTKDRGLYFFYIKVKSNFYPLYIGSGVLSSRIKTRYQKLNPEVRKMYLSFFKTNDLSKKNMEELEKDYIKKLCPVLNISHRSITKIFIENVNAYGQLIKEGLAEEVWE